MRKAFYDVRDFPKLFELATHWEVMREEFLALDAPVLEINRVKKSYAELYQELMVHTQQGGDYGWLQGWGGKSAAGNANWLQYALYTGDAEVPYARSAMPRTLELLSRIEGIKVCALSRMKPNTVLPTHRHPEIESEGLLQLHITLDVVTQRNDAYLNVNGEFAQNRLGSVVVFDGSLDHFAFNASPADRTILYMEFKKSVLMGGSSAHT